VRRFAVVPVILVFALATLVTHGRVRESRAAFPQDQDVLYLPPPEHLQVMSLGYKEALADLVWIRAVIFAGDKVGGQNFVWIEYYLEAIFQLAPTFRRPYAWGGISSIYSGKDPDRESVDNAISLYRRGLTHFPEDHEMLFALGMLLTRDVSSLPGEYTEEEQIAAAAEGRTLIRKSASFGAPPLVRQLAATLVSEDASDQLAIQFLETQMLMAEDDGYKRLLRRKLKRLIGEAGVESVVQLKRDFNDERKANYAYLHHDLYAVIRDDTRSADRSAAASAPK
jgi:hypothetical protein